MAKLEGELLDFDKVFGSWASNKEFRKFLNSEYFTNLLKFINESYSKDVVFPNKKNDVFRIFRDTNYKDIRVVILEDKPHTHDKANGRAYATSDDAITISPCLNNIISVLERDNNDVIIDFDITLSHWVKQGVFLYNTDLTTQKGLVNSHLEIWQPFTTFVLNFIIENNIGVIFFTWGNRNLTNFLRSIKMEKRRLLYHLESQHPKDADFNNEDWECTNFKNANEILKNQNGKEFCIKW